MAKSCSHPDCNQPAKGHCKACNSVSYCSQTCQRSDWPFHKASCKLKQAATANASCPTDVPCVRIYGGGTRYEAAALPSTHEIFNSRPMPVTVRFGYPLVMARLTENLPRETATVNQHATWLQIDPVSGFAPPHWQGGIGDVFVANADGTALSVQTLAAITDYIGDLLDLFGEGNPSLIRQYYDRKRVDEFIKQHLQMQLDFTSAQAGFSQAESD